MGEQWQQTALWEEIVSRGEDTTPVRRTLETCMPNIEAVLKSGGTSPIDFTLHDDEHAFRVAQRMTNLTGKEALRSLSDYEVALLLLSAYLHDIGMTPGRDLAKRHWQFITTGKKGLLSAGEEKSLQYWLDLEKDGLQPPVQEGTPTPEGLDLAEELYAYYCRYKHNDWSEAWIRAELADLRPPPYPGWTDDLVNLCRSHHEGIGELRTARFDARVVGNPGQVINLRFLAALLRVADVIEFDPERTPDVILHHREIVPKSRIFWYKDHAIGFHLAQDASRITFSARTPGAAVHQAVLSTAIWVDSELSCCSTLQQEGAFSRGTIPEDDRQRYCWRWPARLSLDVKEKDDSFVFIDGAFRPDTKKVLQLLSGTALYGSPLAAVRELLQNAFDAIREQIAYERLQQDQPVDKDLDAALGKLHRVRLTFEKDSDGYWLRCSDDGVGMTKSIIERHLLVSGSPPRPELRALERDARAKGFLVGRTGQFGIGIVSYFMLADRMEVTTRRSADAGDTDNTAWRFVTEGIGTFGELTRTSRAIRGTEVRLRIQDEKIKNQHDVWFSILHKYVAETIRWIPCRFELRDETGSAFVWSVGPGWTASENDLSIQVASQINSSTRQDRLLSREEQKERERNEQRWAELRDRALSALRIYGPRECELPNKAGIARIWLPYFVLRENASLCFIDFDDNFIRTSPDKRHIFVQSSYISTSWKGFSVQTTRTAVTATPSIAIKHIDFTQNGQISVDRSKISIDNLDPALDMVQTETEKLSMQFLEEFQNSKYFTLNRCILRIVSEGLEVGAEWATAVVSSEQLSFGKLQFPAADISLPRFRSYAPSTSAVWCGRELGLPATLHAYGGRTNDLALSQTSGGGRLVLFKQSESELPLIGCLWTDPSSRSFKNITDWHSCFPPDWQNLAAIKTESRLFLNSRNEYAKRISKDVQHRKFQGSLRDILRAAAETKEGALVYLVWLLTTILNVGRRFWSIILMRLTH